MYFFPCANNLSAWQLRRYKFFLIRGSESINKPASNSTQLQFSATENGQIAIPKECHVSAFKNYNHNPVLEYGLIEDL